MSNADASTNPTQSLYESALFLVKLHSSEDVEVQFNYDGVDGHVMSSKWFIDQAARQIVLKCNSDGMDDIYLLKRCDLGRSEIVEFDAPAMTAPGL